MLLCSGKACGVTCDLESRAFLCLGLTMRSSLDCAINNAK